jgi:uncharacterized protein (TIGR03083 family)
MTDTEVREAIAAQRRDLVDLLAGLDAANWEAPTLCDGWRVREVVAHITMPFRLSMGRFALEMLRARGNFNKMADRSARADAAVLSSEKLVASLRDNVNHPWKPPGGSFADALSHDVIHGLDITVGLGLERTVPQERQILRRSPRRHRTARRRHRFQLWLRFGAGRFGPGPAAGAVRAHAARGQSAWCGGGEIHLGRSLTIPTRRYSGASNHSSALQSADDVDRTRPRPNSTTARLR